jgi:FkbM family methyltransferase
VRRILRRLRRRTLPAHVRRDIRDHELLVARLTEVLEPDSDCLDVGAHEGAVLRELVRLAPDGSHIAWEPLPAFARRLAAAFPSVDVREAALADRSGRGEFFYVPGEPGWSGFRRRPTPEGGPVETISVRCERLDETLPEGVRPALIKIDVEGAEEQVLHGALETLRRHRPIVAFEHGLGSADHYGTTPERMHELLADALGYRIHGLDHDGPYSRERLAELFHRGERVNFIAYPPGAAQSPGFVTIR